VKNIFVMGALPYLKLPNFSCIVILCTGAARKKPALFPATATSSQMDEPKMMSCQCQQKAQAFAHTEGAACADLCQIISTKRALSSCACVIALTQCKWVYYCGHMAVELILPLQIVVFSHCKLWLDR